METFKMKMTFLYFCSLLLWILIMIPSCKTKAEEIREREIQLQKEKKDSERIVLDNRLRKIDIQDSIATSNFISKYNPLTQIDTLEDLFSYKLKEILLAHSNIVLIKGEIIDINQHVSNKLIVIETSDIDGLCKTICTNELFSEISKSVGVKRGWNDGIFIVRIGKLIPVYYGIFTQIDDFSISLGDESFNEEDLSNYVGIEFSNHSSPFYMIEGELIDFYINYSYIN